MMQKEELNKEIERLIDSPDNMQEFADLASIEKNWRMIDKNIKLPQSVGLAEEKCPSCFTIVRLIYDKFSDGNERLPLICPHCKAELDCALEFTGYTSEAYLKVR